MAMLNYEIYIIALMSNCEICIINGLFKDPKYSMQMAMLNYEIYIIAGFQVLIT